MPLLDLHHVAIKSKNLEDTVAFYTDVLGMEQVERPDFPFPGAWLQMGETMFHIYGGDAAKTHNGTTGTTSAPRRWTILRSGRRASTR